MLPESLGILPTQYSGLYENNRTLRCVYFHRINWVIKFEDTGSIMPFHNTDDCQCGTTCSCNDCDDNTICHVEADFGLCYNVITEDFVGLDF